VPNFDKPQTALVLLAAGQSKRLGQCKALVDLAGQTPLERLIEAGRSISSAQPLVISGADHEKIAKGLPAKCELLLNPDWEMGRSGGVALAAAARAGFDLCIAPVDVPLVPRAVFWAMQNAWQACGSPERGWLAPCFEGRHGHPILIGRALARELAGWEADRPLRELRAKADPELSIGTPHMEVLDDLDRNSDLKSLRQRIS
jgi:molybdenum cofactor cytidylyltransferase